MEERVIHARSAASTSEDDVKRAYDDANEFLLKHDLKQAEIHFRRVLQEQTTSGGDGIELVVGSLVGMADIYFKQGRHNRYNVPQWYRMFLHSYHFRTEAANILNRVRKSESLPVRLQIRLDRFFVECETQLKVLEGSLIGTLPRHLAEVTKGLRTAEVISETTQKWLAALSRFCTSPVNVAEVKDEINDPESQAPPDVEVDEHVAVETIHRKIDFDKVHNAIAGLVKQISSDLRRRYAKSMKCENTLRRSVSLGMQHKLSSQNSSDILTLFEEAIIFEVSEKAESISDKPNDEEEEEEEDLSDQLEELQTYKSTDSIVTDSSENGTDQTGITDNTFGADTKRHRQSDRSVSDIEYPSDCSYIRATNEETDIGGVITHWKAYSSEKLNHLHRRHTLENFEELSPLTEISHFTSRPMEGDHNSNDHFNLDVLTSESKLRYTFSCLVAKSAKLLQDEGHLKEAVNLYKFVLGVLEDYPVENVHGEFVGDILKNLGLIKCEQNNVECGIRLFEEAIVVFGGEDFDSVRIAEVLVKMGKCYMAEHRESSLLINHVMELVKSDVENEVSLDEIHHIPQDMVSDTDSDCSQCETVYSVSVQEATSCFNQALSMLSRLRKQNELHTNLYVDVLSAYGDCCILTGNYDRAVLCYEEAIVLFPDSSGTSSLASNAHVLSMLGSANFLLGNYIKAASMYETAAVLQRHLQDGEEDVTIESAFNLTMLGITFHAAKLYHRGVRWCFTANEQYVQLYKDLIVFIPRLHMWFILQNLFNLGYAYNTLDVTDKALSYFAAARQLISRSTTKDIIQLVKILKATADVCHKNQEHIAALGYYEDALTEAHHMGEVKSAVALQNQLLNCIASVHVTTKQYGDAAGYLKQALDCQRNVQSSIHGDFMGIMYQLAITHTLAGEVDKAIDCYKECLDIYSGLRGPESSALMWILCNVATLYHVKACLLDEDDEVSDDEETSVDFLLNKAEQCYKEALEFDQNSNVCIHFANFLYQQGRSADALLAMLPRLFVSRQDEKACLVFNGVEQAVLPDCLQNETQDVDEFTIDGQMFSLTLAILCFKQLGLMQDVDDCLIKMCTSAVLSPNALSYSLFGYSLLEMNMFEDAFEAFIQAAAFKEGHCLEMNNACMCMCLWVYTKIAVAIRAFWDHHYAPVYISLPSKVYRYLSIGSRQISSCEESEDSDEYLRTQDVQQTLSASSSILEAIRKKSALLQGEEKGRYSGSSEKIDLLATIRQVASRDRSRSRSPRPPQDTPENVSESTDDTDEIVEWEEEETVDTPTFLLEYLHNVSYDDDTENVRTRSVESDTPKVTEAVHADLGQSGSRLSVDEHVAEDEQVWMTSEVLSVDTPEVILKLLESGALLSDYVTTSTAGGDDPLKSQTTLAENPYNFNVDERAEKGSDDDDDEEGWTMTEEVVDTPIELIQYLRQSVSEEMITSTLSASKSSGSSTSISDSDHYRSSTPHEEETITSESIISNIRQQQQQQQGEQQHKQQQQHQQLQQLGQQRDEEQVNCNYISEDSHTHRELFRYSQGSYQVNRGTSQEYTPSSEITARSHDRLNGNIADPLVSHLSQEAWSATDEDDSNQNEGWERWESEEVSTPAEILRLMQHQQQ